MARILIVEDNELNRELLRRRLERVGHEVLEESDGEPAVKRAILEIPDVILMDLGLPKMSGWEAIENIRSHGGLKQVPIVVLTAHAMPEHRERAEAAGCSAFLAKPFDFKDLMDMLKQYLDA